MTLRTYHNCFPWMLRTKRLNSNIRIPMEAKSGLHTKMTRINDLYHAKEKNSKSVFDETEDLPSFFLSIYNFFIYSNLVFSLVFSISFPFSSWKFDSWSISLQTYQPAKNCTSWSKLSSSISSIDANCNCPMTISNVLHGDWFLSE